MASNDNNSSNPARAFQLTQRSAADQPSTHPTQFEHEGPSTEPLIDERKPDESLEGPPTVPTLQPPLDARDARDMRDSRLRREFESSTLSAPSTSMLMAREQQSLSFFGSGSEYFRIWIINLTLTILTLGVYGAWAKVRRLQYFYRATSLEGACFDYIAKPMNILGGRVIALGLFGLYYLAYKFMPELGTLVVLLVIAVLPYLMQQSHRFKARNTVHRSVAFHFDGSVAAAYQTYLPPLIVVFLPSVIASLVLSEAGALWAGILFLLGTLAFPFFHAVFRRFMQRNSRYGDAAFGFDATNREFFAVWIHGIGLSILLGLVFAMVIFALVALAMIIFKGTGESKAGLMGDVIGVLAGYLVYSCIGAYYTARFQKLVWEHTALGDISFRCNLSATKLLKLQVKNTLLIICTLGLYRPFAAIHVAKLRLESMTVVGTERLDEFFSAPDKSSGGAVGEGAAELFDMDVSF